MSSRKTIVRARGGNEGFLLEGKKKAGNERKLAEKAREKGGEEGRPGGGGFRGNG